MKWGYNCIPNYGDLDNRNKLLWCRDAVASLSGRGIRPYHLQLRVYEIECVTWFKIFHLSGFLRRVIGNFWFTHTQKKHFLKHILFVFWNTFFLFFFLLLHKKEKLRSKFTTFKIKVGWGKKKLCSFCVALPCSSYDVLVRAIFAGRGDLALSPPWGRANIVGNHILEGKALLHAWKMVFGPCFA